MFRKSWLWLVPLTLAALSAGCSTYEGDDDASSVETTDQDHDGYYSDVDCDDTDPNVHPGIEDICGDQVDNDCDGTVDNSRDADHDGAFTCPTDGSTPDCDDSNPAVYPTATEVCDGIDNNCNGQADEGFDKDGDGHLDATACGASGDDCDDANAQLYPGAPEACNGKDENCNGLIDESFDNDGDGHLDAATCAAQGGDDCDDANPKSYPGASETCDHQDNNCNGQIDENFDVDQDGVSTCDYPADCNDKDATIYPGAIEICDNTIDENCDGQDGSKTDTDGDGYTTCGDGPLDCDESDKFTNPAALEQCDMVDNNCNGIIDDGVSNDTYESNDTKEKAYNLGLIDGEKKTLEASIGSTTDQDWFSFDSKDENNDFWRILVDLTNIPEGADYDVYLYRSTGALILASQNDGSADEHIDFEGFPGEEDSGTYLVEVVWKGGKYGCDSYTLSIYGG